MFDLEKIVRKHIANVEPYSSARDEFNGEAKIFLDANENSIGSVVSSGKFNRYPDPHQDALKEKITELKKISKKKIFLGNGSDEIIDLIIRAFVEPGEDEILIMPPTYGMYEVTAAVNNVSVNKIPLTEHFEIDIEAVQDAISEKTKLLFICSPNNPSGNIADEQKIKELIKNFNGIVVLDEAYIDFAKTQSWTNKISKIPNLIVLQTFSKAWGLPSLRLGIAYADKNIISILNKIKPPYNVSGYTQKIAIEALENIEVKNKLVRQIVFRRKMLSAELSRLDAVVEIHPTQANFILVKTTDADDIYKYLIKNEIVVRNRTNLTNCENCLRITVGTELENKKLIEVLKKY